MFCASFGNADVYVEHRIARSILMEESRFKSAEFGVSQGAGVRVVAGDKSGYAYTEEITEEALLRAAEVASYIARGTDASEPVSIDAPSDRQTFGTVQLPLDDIADSIAERYNQSPEKTRAAVEPKCRELVDAGFVIMAAEPTALPYHVSMPRDQLDRDEMTRSMREAGWIQ